MVGPCGGHARKDGRTGFSSAAPAALQPLRWPHGVLKRCTCRASTFKMAVQGSQALRLPRFNLLDGRTGSQVLRPSRVGELRVSHAQETSPSYEVKDSDIMLCPLPHCPLVHSSRPWEPQRAVNDLAKAMKALDGKKGPGNPSGPNGPTTNWITGTTSQKSGNETCVKTKQSQSWSGCRLDDQP